MTFACRLAWISDATTGSEISMSQLNWSVMVASRGQEQAQAGFRVTLIK